MNCLIIGASAGLGAALAAQLAAQGHHLFLIASDERDLSPLSQDLSIRFGITVNYMAVDLIDVDGEELRRKVLEVTGTIEALFYVAGYGNPALDCGTVEQTLLRRLITVNFTSSTEIINSFLDHLSGLPKAHLVGIGSVATIRGRRTNMVYGASKRGFEFYFTALRHAYQQKTLRIQFYRLGFMKTSLFGTKKSLIPAADPNQIASQIISNLNKDTAVKYLPYWWQFIAIILKLMPWSIFRRLSI